MTSEPYNEILVSVCQKWAWIKFAMGLGIGISIWAIPSLLKVLWDTRFYTSEQNKGDKSG